MKKSVILNCSPSNKVSSWHTARCTHMEGQLFNYKSLSRARTLPDSMSNFFSIFVCCISFCVHFRCLFDPFNFVLPFSTYFLDAKFPRNFLSEVKQIYKRLFRLYAHLYCTHNEKIRSIGANAHLNTCFKHFIYFVLGKKSKWNL